MRHVKSTVLAIVLAALIPAAGSAQEPEADPAATFSDLALRLPAQSFVIVTDQQGRRTTGRLIGIERDALSIRTDRALSFRQSEVQQVQRKIPDRVLDGGLIGFAIGMVAPLTVCTSISDSSETRRVRPRFSRLRRTARIRHWRPYRPRSRADGYAVPEAAAGPLSP